MMNSIARYLLAALPSLDKPAAVIKLQTVKNIPFDIKYIHGDNFY